MACLLLNIKVSMDAAFHTGKSRRKGAAASARAVRLQDNVTAAREPA